MAGAGFQWFVAWRYLLARPRKFSRVAVKCVIAALALAAVAFLAGEAAERGWFVLRIKRFELTPENAKIAWQGALGFGSLSLFIGVLRYFFTFFTTVPITGVWVGSSALVCVLSVMNGFEAELRGNILGSNAHLQITRKSGDFTEWEHVKKKVDGTPGVVASMPFVTSEGVISANSNYATVILKGIDPDLVAKVTRLATDLDDRDAILRLRPLIDEPAPLAPAIPAGGKPGAAVDPAPEDMPSGGEPMDFSQEEKEDPAVVKARADLSTWQGLTGVPSDDTYGGVVRELIVDVDDLPAVDKKPSAADALAKPPVTDDADPPALDPAPADFAGGPDVPDDLSGVEDNLDVTIDAVALDGAAPLGRRVQSLPGILVGRELDNQIHLYTGQEVKVISPLSDPSNPDATGTPIPYNRDFRVAGVFYTGNYEYDLKFVYVPLEALQDFLDLGDAVDGLEVRVPDPDNTDEIVYRLSALLGSRYEIKDWQELNRSLFSALKLEKIAMFAILAITILVASFSIIGNLIMVVVEKAKEIALIKTLGASDTGVMLIFVVQGFFIGIIGTSLGLITGLTTCFIAEKVGIPIPQQVYYISKLPIEVDPDAVVRIGIAGIVISILATIYPAAVASRMRPALGLRE